LPKDQHLEVSTIGTAAAFGAAYMFERGRRQSIHESHLDAALATNDANIFGQPIPDWAEGNTGNIFQRRPK
jgi:hypothetical protein